MKLRDNDPRSKFILGIAVTGKANYTRVPQKWNCNIYRLKDKAAGSVEQLGITGCLSQAEEQKEGASKPSV